MSLNTVDFVMGFAFFRVGNSMPLVEIVVAVADIYLEIPSFFFACLVSFLLLPAKYFDRCLHEVHSSARPLFSRVFLTRFQGDTV